MSQDKQDLYALLGIARSASPAEIGAAFAAAEATARAAGGETWERLQYARDVLTSPQRRELYDSLLADTDTPALNVELLLSSDRLAVSDDPQLLYALLTIRPNQELATRRQPLNLALVVDRSTSMRGERLDRVRASVELIVDKLGPDDVLSLVTFSDRAQVVLPASNLSGRTPTGALEVPGLPADWRDRLNGIAASGGTEIYHGLRAGLEQIRSRPLDGATNHLILLTDGHTYGDVVECLQLAEAAADDGIGMSAFGIGSDWNDHFLDALVAPSGGQSGHIQEPADLIGLLESRLSGLSDVHAQQVRLQQAWPAQLTLRDAFKLAPYAQPVSLKRDTVPLGDMEGRSSLSFILEFEVAPQPAPSRINLPITVYYKPAGGHTTDNIAQLPTISQTAQLLVMKGIDRQADEPATAVLEAVRHFNLYAMQERAWNEAESGQLETAAERMRLLTTRYLESGDLKLAQQAQQEAQRLAHIGKMSPEGRKLLRYGTRSLMGDLPE